MKKISLLSFKDRKSSIPCTMYLWQCALRLAGILFLTAGLLLVTARLWLPRIGHWLAQPPRVNRADAIVALGGSNSRTLHSITLYRQGLAPEIWYTGDCLCSGETISFAQSAAQFSIERGVPAKAIRLLATTSTWEDGQEIAVLAKERQVQSILVVTNWAHSRRALCVIEQQLAGSGIAIYYAPPNSLYEPEKWWQHNRGRVAVFKELVKIGFYWVRYGTAPWDC